MTPILELSLNQLLFSAGRRSSSFVIFHPFQSWAAGIQFIRLNLIAPIECIGGPPFFGKHDRLAFHFDIRFIQSLSIITAAWHTIRFQCSHSLYRIRQSWYLPSLLIWDLASQKKLQARLQQILRYPSSPPFSSLVNHLQFLSFI